MQNLGTGPTITSLTCEDTVVDLVLKEFCISLLVPHQRTPVVFGGLHGELSYDDDSFIGVDPDIQRLFYGDDVAAP